MSTRWKIALVSLTLLLLLVLLFILIRFVGAPGYGAPFDVSDAWMTLCSSGNMSDTEAKCSESPKMTSFSSSESSDICVAWIESNRSLQHKISIQIISPNDSNRVISTFEGPTAIPLEQDACRMAPVLTPLSPGTYQTKIISEHQVVAGEDGSLIWIINDEPSLIPQPLIQEPQLTLTTTTTPNSYQRVGDNITYNYRITNTGPIAVDSPQFVINDSKFDFPINCGPADTTLTPSVSLICSATYIITQADIEAGSVTSTASIEGQEAAPVTTVLTSNCKPPTDWVPYELRTTDTLDTISQWYNDLTLENLMQANCLNKSTLAPGQIIYVPNTPLSAKIIGMVFMDPNHNDIQDRGELGLGGTPVKITDSSGAIVATPVTGVNGAFEVDLPPGTYFLYQFQIILQPGEVRNQKFAVVPVPGN